MENLCRSEIYPAGNSAKNNECPLLKPRKLFVGDN